MDLSKESMMMEEEVDKMLEQESMVCYLLVLSKQFESIVLLPLDHQEKDAYEEKVLDLSV